MKLIALDVGTKRIGVAKADSSVRVAVPYSAVEVDGNEFNKIASLARAWDIQSFVLGLPRNNSGQETKQSQYVRQFAAELKRAIPEAKICFQDESLTSVEAEKRLKKRKKGYKKGDIDSEAAAIILQDFLEEHGGGKTTTKATAARSRSVKGAKPPRTHHLATAILVILLTLVIGCAGAYAYYRYNLEPVYTDVDCDDSEDVDTEPCRTIIFTVHDGESVGDIALNLHSAGLIRNSVIFQLHYRLSYADEGSIKAGEYQLQKSMSLDEIMTQLIEGGSDENVFSLTILPGSTIFEVKEILTEIGCTPEEIEAAFSTDYSNESFAWVFDGRPEDAGLEGYLYGETYEFFEADTATTIVRRMIKEMADVIAARNIQERFAERGLNLYQGITLSSIVQKEAHEATDQARVAQVFYNRIDHNMTLGSDVTVTYGWDVLNPDRDRESVDNAEKLQLDSPYNTRLHPGLPYGPISSPGLQALEATAAPDYDFAKDYLFFLTGDDGVMYYSDTEEGHNQNRVHCPNLCGVAL